jgi:hypothetical protein
MWNMKIVKKPKPLADCDVCHAPTNLKMDVNQRCGRTVHGRRCPGIFRAGLGKTWNECQSCSATGSVGSQVCSECAGFGWRLFR